MVTRSLVELGARATLTVFCTMFAAPAAAQIIINPTRVEFDSQDHHATLSSGEPAISHYVLEVWPRSAAGTGTPAGSLELGKPTVAEGSTRVSLYVASFLLALTAGNDYVATIRAVGPAGESQSAISNEFTRLNGPTPTSPPVVTDPANEVVIHAADIQPANIHGQWALVATSGAAGGLALFNADRSAAKPSAALASPADYVEFTFSAATGVPYRLWVRMQALNDYYGNDSVFVQFTDSVDANNQPRFRLGTTDGAVVILEDGTGSGLSRWGWNDHGWMTMADPIYFATNGPHVIRIQQREDGVYLDQIVLSAGTFLSKSPGALKNDTTIVPKP